MRRISPVPWQSGHSVGSVPTSAPLPPHVPQVTGRRMPSSLRAPNAASANSSCSVTSASAPGWGPRRRPRPAVPAIEPKNASNRSPRPPSKPKPWAPAVPFWPKLAGPNWS